MTQPKMTAERLKRLMELSAEDAFGALSEDPSLWDDIAQGLRQAYACEQSGIVGALEACTHEANDTNCQDWPHGRECYACAGDEQRAEAITRYRELAGGGCSVCTPERKCPDHGASLIDFGPGA